MLEYFMVFDNTDDIILHCYVENVTMARAIGRFMFGYEPKRVQERQVVYEDSDASLALLTDRAQGRRGYLPLKKQSTWAEAEQAVFVEWLTRQEKIDRLI